MDATEPSLVIQTVYSFIYFLYDQCKPVRVSLRSSLDRSRRSMAGSPLSSAFGSLDERMALQTGWVCSLYIRSILISYPYS